MGMEDLGGKPLAAAALLALLPGLGAAVAVGAVAAASLTVPEGGSLVAEALPPALAGFVGGWVLGLLGVRLGGSLSLAGALDRLHSRLHQSGLNVPRDGARWFRPGEVDEALHGLAERVSLQVVASRKDAGKYKEALGRYTEASLVRNLSGQSTATSLGVRKVRMAVLFCDIRGFTKMSEALRVDDVVSVLNGYFSFGAQAVAAHDGQINKFIGDAILAIFTDPPDRATGMTACRNAVKAGMDLVDAFRREERRWKESISTPFEAGLGVGIHYGEVIHGSMGSPERLEYTVIGDTVNFASRLCSLAKAGQIRLSEECFRNVDDQITADEMDPVAVKGKSGEYKTYLVTGRKPGAL